MIISQTKIFNVFLDSIQAFSISKILTANCKRYTFEYIPTRNFGYIGFILKYQILIKKLVSQLTAVTLMLSGRPNSDLTPKVELNRFSIITEIEKISLLIVFWR